MSEREVTRWMDASHLSGGLPDPEDELYDKLREVADALVLEHEKQVLVYVGTLLVHRGLEDLWREMYPAVTTDIYGDAVAWLRERTLAITTEHG